MCSSDLLNTFAAQFARRLPNISDLDIHDAKDSGNHTNIHPSTFAMLSSFRSVAHLSLRDCKLRTFSDFQTLICTFPKLSTLLWDECSCKHTPRHEPLVNTHPERPRLASLVVYDPHTPERPKLYSWLSRTPSTTNTIRSISLPFPETDEEHSSVGSLVRAVGSLLTELRFAIYGMSL